MSFGPDTRGETVKLSSMRYKGFVWPHNPRIYTITFQRSMAVHKVPFGRCRLQSLGMTRRVMKGEGEFVGEDAYRQFKALASIFYEDTPGTLLHPLWDASSAWFVNLELAQEPRENYVSYRFEFWEDCTLYQTGVERIAAPAAADPAADPAGAAQEASGPLWNGPPVLDGAGTGGEYREIGKNRSQYHTVTQGQNLWSIAQQHGMGADELIALNPEIKNPNLVHVGQKVKVR